MNDSLSDRTFHQDETAQKKSALIAASNRGVGSGLD